MNIRSILTVLLIVTYAFASPVLSVQSEAEIDDNFTQLVVLKTKTSSTSGEKLQAGDIYYVCDPEYLAKAYSRLLANSLIFGAVFTVGARLIGRYTREDSFSTGLATAAMGIYLPLNVLYLSNYFLCEHDAASYYEGATPFDLFKPRSMKRVHLFSKESQDES